MHVSLSLTHAANCASAKRVKLHFERCELLAASVTAMNVRYGLHFERRQLLMTSAKAINVRYGAYDAGCTSRMNSHLQSRQCQESQAARQATSKCVDKTIHKGEPWSDKDSPFHLHFTANGRESREGKSLHSCMCPVKVMFTSVEGLHHIKWFVA